MLRRPRISSASKARLEQEVKAFLPGHSTARPKRWRAGIVFASPHSGHNYPAAFVRRTQPNLHGLRSNEDMYVDELISSVVTSGAANITARFPRCYVDLNRAPDEFLIAGTHKTDTHGTDTPAAETLSARAQAGLGVVPTHINENTAIYNAPLTAYEIHIRLEQLYHPYHAALKTLLSEAKHQFGQALLIDCHSMPGFAPLGVRRPDIILGDRFGKSCDPQTLKFVRTLFEKAGYSVGINYPYAGGFVTQTYGTPDRAVEALQIEINRDLYMNPVTQKKKRGFKLLQKNLSAIFEDLIHNAAPQNLAAQ